MAPQTQVPHNVLAHRKARRDSLLHPDPYAQPGKHAGVLCCTLCGVVYQAGQWHWQPAPTAARPILCPACRRVRQRYAAHLLRIAGVPRDQRAELLHMVCRIAELERAEHPLERLMLLRDQGSAIELATTGTHLARRLLASLLRRWRHHLHVQHGADSSRLRWHA